MQNKKVWFLVLIILGIYAVAGYGQQTTKIQILPFSSPQVSLAELQTLIDPDPDLPQPVIKDSLVREFTQGSTNTIQWSVNELTGAINDPSVTVKFFEIKAEFIKDGQPYVYWGIINSPDSSVTFTNLPEYIKISYYLRYFVGDAGKPGFRMSRWSVPVMSIQDYNPPVIESDSSYIANLNDLGDQQWIIGNVAVIRVTASDLPIGKIELIKVHEDGQNEVLFPVRNPKTEIDTVIYYTLKGPQKTSVNFDFWVTDVSLQYSERVSEEIIWMTEEEGLDDLICFPNPFNPEFDQRSKIKVGIPGVTEARIFDAFGNLIIELSKESTADFFTWDGRNGRGDFVASGGYICVVKGRQKYYCKIAVYR